MNRSQPGRRCVLALRLALRYLEHVKNNWLPACDWPSGCFQLPRTSV